MAKHKVIHSDDATQINIYGNRKNPEPSTVVIQFPGGHVEVCRCSDNQYWVHVEVVEPKNIIDSRVDYDYEGWVKNGINDIPDKEHIKKLAIKVNPISDHFERSL